MQWIKSFYNDVVSTELDEGPRIEEMFTLLPTSDDKTSILYDIYNCSFTNHSVFLQHLDVLTKTFASANSESDAALIKIICKLFQEIIRKPKNSDGFEEDLIVEGIYKEMPQFDKVLCEKLNGMKDMSSIQAILSTITFLSKNYREKATFECFFEMSQLYPFFIKNLPNALLHKDIVLFLTTISKDNMEIQKVLVFNGIFDVIATCWEDGQYLKNPRKVVDYFELVKVLLLNNTQNQKNFTELGYAKKMLQFIDNSGLELQDDQVQCILQVYSVLHIFLEQTNPNRKAYQQELVEDHIFVSLGGVCLSDIQYTQSFATFLKESLKIVSSLLDSNEYCQKQFATTKIPLYHAQKKEIYALDRVIPIALGSPNVEVQLSAYEIFLSYLKNNPDGQLSIASTLLPLHGVHEEVTIGNYIMNAFFKKENVKTYMIASMLLNVIFMNPTSRYVFSKPVTTDDDKTFLDVFIETVATTEERSKALSLLKILITVTYEADNDFLIKLMNETLFSYLLLKSSDSDIFHSSLACLVLFNVLNELKFNSAPHSNTEIIEKISKAIESIGYDVLKRRLEAIAQSKEFQDAKQVGISEDFLFDRESVKFIEKVSEEIKLKKESGEAKLKVRETEVLKDTIEDLTKENGELKKKLGELQIQTEELQNALELEKSVNETQEVDELKNECEELKKKIAMMECEKIKESDLIEGMKEDRSKDFSQRNDQLEKENEELKRENEKLCGEIETLKDELFLNKMQLEEYVNVNDELTETQKTLEKKIEELLKNSKTEIQSQESDVKLKTDGIEGHEIERKTQEISDEVKSNVKNVESRQEAHEEQDDVLDSFGEVDTQQSLIPQHSTESDGKILKVPPPQQIDSTKEVNEQKETQQKVQDQTTGGVTMPKITINELFTTINTIFK
ncbi:general vesicular transport factor p115, putative [Entamoeba invadens IP1]|uniref:General vesicular transport factor p115, putative n=1 Tax=Entamoeba invadens IP1 TaxID=370355 RepID=A0A0A1U633_ENTIV|nr:general vesicular transport factor p115, putative [Entamoeba invadens IP1]ELP87296.1 general vesicular transport factor p115, putative [Entamoeba invadens IP1]|eukprot:XP_004254067.1 general vesicular transport factor p115, putative [Entamoeba invadens IP1]